MCIADYLFFSSSFSGVLCALPQNRAIFILLLSHRMVVLHIFHRCNSGNEDKKVPDPEQAPSFPHRYFLWFLVSF
ncbi:MAG: hypothetical protein WCP39_07440 [Chlamydiota bacterium]